MKLLHRNKRKIRICKVNRQGSLKVYDEPIELYENWQMTNVSSEVKNTGLEVYDTIRIRTTVDHAKYYHLGDRAYVFVEPPTVHDSDCRTADYEVYTDPLVTLNECQIWLKKLSGRNGSKNIY